MTTHLRVNEQHPLITLQKEHQEDQKLPQQPPTYIPKLVNVVPVSNLHSSVTISPNSVCDIPGINNNINYFLLFNTYLELLIT